MKTQRVLAAVSIITVALAIAILLWQEAYFVVISLIAGISLTGHRELWSLIKMRKLPTVDERGRENINKSLRNGFLFFAVASAFLMLFFYWFTGLFSSATPNTAHILGGLFLAGGVVYTLSYLFYDRAEPKLDEKQMKTMRTFLMVAGISAGGFIISVVLHNLISGLSGVEEPVFFILAVIIAPAAVAAGLIGSLVIFVKGLLTKTQ